MEEKKPGRPAKRPKGVMMHRDGYWVVRIRAKQPDGTERVITKRVVPETREKAIALRREMKSAVSEQRKSKSYYNLPIGFAELADRFIETEAVPPVYERGRKVAGMKTFKSVITRAAMLKNYFGKTDFRQISFADLKRFKSRRLQTPTVQGNARTIATVNRELGILRSIFIFAKQARWIDRSPFEDGKGLIVRAHEVERTPVLSHSEEAKLLAVCSCADSYNRQQYKHLRPILICLLDTGMRSGELKKLTWKQIDKENRIITLYSQQTKTEQERHVALTKRFLNELDKMERKGEIVFRVTNVRDSWKRVKELAGIERNFWFHDLRHIYAQRAVENGVDGFTLQKLLGHTSPSMTSKYFKPNQDDIRRVADLFDKD